MGDSALSSPLPLWERVDAIAQARSRRVRGSLRGDETPHPALRATFSHKGRREERGYPAPTAFLRQARCTAQVQPGGCEVTSLAGTAAIGAGAFAAAWSCEGM